MTNTPLTKLQTTSQQILQESIFDPKRLRQRCPLKVHNGRDLLVNYELGALIQLPAELQHHILGYVDVASLFVFLRVNRCALDTVNQMVEFQKVMSHAADSIRMAFAIDTAHTFSIKQLFSKLCQKRCDGEKCSNYAPYIDVFTLARRCLSTGGGCPIPLGPVSRDMLQEAFDLADDLAFPNRSFRAIPGSYSNYFTRLAIRTTNDTDDVDEVIFYDYCEVRPTLLSASENDRLAAWDIADSYQDIYWSLCSTTAPWLNATGYLAEYGVFCDICKHNTMDDDVPESITGGRDRPIAESSRSVNFPDPRMMTFMTIEAFRKHMEEEHGDVKETET